MRQMRVEPPLTRAAAERHDPAPSRLAYRLHRMWLRRGFRHLVRIGLPVMILALAVGLWLGDPSRRDTLVQGVADLRTEFRQRPEFMVNLLAIEGASPVLAESVRRALALDLPRSSFEIDLDAVRAVAETFDAVARADVRVVSGGVLRVTLTERLPALVWRTDDALWLMDAGGHRIATITARGLRADLPLVAGTGADDAAPEALALFAAAGPLAPRIRGLVRHGERRWDVVLDHDQRLLLPALNPVRALERVIALDQAEDVLSHDVQAVDLRDPRRLVLRLGPDAVDGLRNPSNVLTSEARL